MMKLLKTIGCAGLAFLPVMGAWAQVQPGMKVDAFRKVYPEIVPGKVYYDEGVTAPEKIGVLDGNWYLDFNHDSLQSIYYSYNAGMRPAAGTMAAFDTLIKKYTAQMGAPVWEKTAADTSLRMERKRKENVDSIRVVCWKTRYADVVVGLYFTGDHKIKMTPQEKAAQRHENNADRGADYYRFNIHVERAEHRGEVYSWALYPGLHVYKVMELKPAYFPYGIGVNGQWARDESFYGLSSGWAYNFKNSELKWMMWNYYAGKQDKPTFEKCLKATQGIIEQYTQQYGTPVIVTGETKYRDPYKKQHWGYDVMKASWDMKTYTIEVSYVFMGGKGQYDLLVKIEQTLK